MSAFVTPSQAEQTEEARLLARGELFDGLGRRRIVDPGHVGEEKPKLVGYTRVTSFISTLEDTTALQKWRTRLILEGASDADLENKALTAYQQYLEDERMVEVDIENGHLEGLSKTRRAEIVDAPGKEYRKRLGDIAEEAFYLAGGRDSADYGTELHNLADLMHTSQLEDHHVELAEEKWPGIADDFAAYWDAWGEFAKKYDVRVLMTESLLVNDKMKIAGRTDLICLGRLPGDQRARRFIVDLKTGSIDNELRLSQQLAMYSGSKLYDPETGVRTSARIRQDVGVIAHIPRGEKRAAFHLVNLAPGRAANALCMKVREARRRQPGIMTELVEAEA